MGKLIFHSEKIKKFEEFAKICPFGAIEMRVFHKE